jgi:hypothetical protein
VDFDSQSLFKFYEVHRLLKIRGRAQVFAMLSVGDSSFAANDKNGNAEV